ncbi:UAF complex subunit Rrn10 [Penicillium cf. griseofulvum]|uniref:UAF complex subunit Rrn10 n=1 Tax=Penicillium cf. griseofulvum TaxID=2972120 RepID=A0A9W9ITX3_9EURO|nr:UAF complex subunit Rrn10 [Penicillium cf. griseofulvum]KAJ5430107.1 UAF complex subunit Rrn10 [Penicillium cf. griseofulvum]
MSATRLLDSDEHSFAESVEDRQELLDNKPSRHAKRRANVYDAVAGRVNARGLNAPRQLASQYRDTNSAGARSLRPEELLYRRQNIPAESIDERTYFAHENLPSDQALPNSDLLETIHAYAADYYEYATADNGKDDHQTMDETALLAMGILIEEMAKEELGETGDLALIEGQELSEEEDDKTGPESDTTTKSAARAARRKRTNSIVRQSSKRRKLSRSVSVTTDFDTEVDERR